MRRDFVFAHQLVAQRGEFFFRARDKNQVVFFRRKAARKRFADAARRARDKCRFHISRSWKIENLTDKIPAAIITAVSANLVTPLITGKKLIRVIYSHRI